MSLLCDMPWYRQVRSTLITSRNCRCRYTGILEDLEQGATYLALASHFLCYFNSAINPVIYSFMSGTSLTLCVEPPVGRTSLTRIAR